jgi:hypothetical protein
MNEQQIRDKANGKDKTPAVAQPFGKVRFGIPANRTVSDKWGRVSVIMLDAIVSIIGTGLHIKTAIYANLERKSDGAEISASAYLPKKVLGVDVEGAADAFLAHVENAAVKFPGYDDAFNAATSALLGFADPSLKQPTTLAKSAPRPKLVRPASMATKAPTTEAVVTPQPSA